MVERLRNIRKEKQASKERRKLILAATTSGNDMSIQIPTAKDHTLPSKRQRTNHRNISSNAYMDEDEEVASHSDTSCFPRQRKIISKTVTATFSQTKG